jgi:hypothetical protein
MDWDMFREYELVKVYALKERTVPDETEQERFKLMQAHMRLGRNFLERPEEALWEHFCHLLRKETQKIGTQACVEHGNKFAHGRPKLTKVERTAKKNPKRAASAQLKQSDVISIALGDYKVNSAPRDAEEDHQLLRDSDAEMN